MKLNTNPNGGPSYSVNGALSLDFADLCSVYFDDGYDAFAKELGKFRKKYLVALALPSPTIASDFMNHIANTWEDGAELEDVNSLIEIWNSASRVSGPDKKPDLPDTRIDRIRKYVKERFHEKYYHQVPLSDVWKNSDHIIAIGTSILCTAWNVGIKGGSFVQAVADNDLYLAFKRADSTNRYCLDFYSELVHETTPIR